MEYRLNIGLLYKDDNLPNRHKAGIHEHNRQDHQRDGCIKQSTCKFNKVIHFVNMKLVKDEALHRMMEMGGL